MPLPVNSKHFYLTILYNFKLIAFLKIVLKRVLPFTPIVTPVLFNCEPISTDSYDSLVQTNIQL